MCLMYLWYWNTWISVIHYFVRSWQLPDEYMMSNLKENIRLDLCVSKEQKAHSLSRSVAAPQRER